MVEWWEAMSLIEQVFASIGIAATVLLIVQLILLLVGAGADGHADMSGGGHDVDASAVHIDAHDASGAGDAPDAHVAGDVSIDIDATHVGAHAGDWYGDMPDAHGAGHTEYAGSGLHLFTLQGIVAFFAVFGWSGLVMMTSGWSTGLSVFLAIVFGLAAMTLMALAYRAMLKLQQDGSMDIRNALGKSATVYLTVPAKRENTGKVTVLVQEQLVEMEAVTDEEQPIKTGAEVTVMGISGGRTLIVRRK